MPHDVTQNAENIGRYILNQIANQRGFGLNEAQIADVEPEFQSQVYRWILIYVGWLLYRSAGRRFGESFAAGIVPAITQAANTPNERRAASDTTVWFPRLDAAATKPQMIAGGPTPRVLWPVLAFVLEDPLSLYANQEDTPIVKFIRLFRVIDQAAIAAAPTLRAIAGPDTGLEELVFLGETIAAANSVPKKGGLLAIFTPQRIPNVTCPYCHSSMSAATNTKPSPSASWVELKKCPNCGHDLPQLLEL
jgi:hypothetical protein